MRARLTWNAPGTVLILALGVAGCSGGEHRPLRLGTPSIPSLTLGQLLQAPDSLQADGVTLSTQVSLWRDFMNQPQEGSPLMASLRLYGTPPDTIPASVGDVYLWVIRGSDVWSAKMTPGPIDADRTRTYGAFDGPRWGPGIMVDVVIGVRTSPTHVPLVLLKDVPILKTL